MTILNSTLHNDFELNILSGPNPHNKEDWQAIAFDVELKYKGKTAANLTYKMGLGHVKPKGGRNIVMTRNEQHLYNDWARKPNAKFYNKDLPLSVACKLAKAQEVKPSLDDVIYCILNEGQPFFDREYFEEWADNFGYSSDSIKHKEMFEACLKTGKEFSRAVPDSVIEGLKELFQDY